MAEPPGSGTFHNKYSVADQGTEAFFSCNRSAKAEVPLALEHFIIDKLKVEESPGTGAFHNRSVKGRRISWHWSIS